MSVYSTPLKSSFDEGSSPSSINSFYFTPRTTFSHTLQRSSRTRTSKWKGKIPKFEIYNEELTESDINLKKHELLCCKLSSSANVCWEHNGFPSPAKETSVDKENYGIRFSSTPSLFRGDRSQVCSPLKNISNSCIDEKCGADFDGRISKFGKQRFHLRITTNNGDELKKEIADSTVCRISSKENLSDKSKKSTLFRGIGRKFKRNKTAEFKKKIKMMCSTTQSKKYISQDSSKFQNLEPNPNDLGDEDSNIKEMLDSLCVISQSTDNSEVPLIEKKSVKKSTRWPFVRIVKVRMSPVRRLFSKSTKYVISLKQSLLKKLSMKPIRNLFDRRKLDYDENKMETSNSNVIPNNVCGLCITNLTNKDEMVSQALSSLLSKLSTMEEELKDIKNMIKSGALVHTNSLRSFPPPPPPPPPPPNFLNPSGTLKRKADLTTPENNDHPVKRPAIKSEVKTHFAITVEDIKSVKLRKTPATLTKKESKNLIDENFRSLKMKKSRRSGISDKKRSLTLAELSNRENISLNRKPISEYKSPKRGNISSPIYNETPVTSKNGLSGGRSHKRKELLIESPVRKRFNDGNNSPIHCDNESE